MPNLREAEAVTRALESALANTMVVHVPALVKRIISEVLWVERLIPVRGVFSAEEGPPPDRKVCFTRFIDYVTTPPVDGLGTDADTLRRLCAKDLEAVKLLEEVLADTDKEGAPYGNQNAVKTTVSIVNSCFEEEGRDSPVGNTAAYARRALRTHAPDIYEEVSRGALSPHAGMIKAGLRQKTRTIPDDPVQAARSLARAFDTDQLLQLIDELTRYLVGSSDGLDSL
jgi:hypothetical protein